MMKTQFSIPHFLGISKLGFTFYYPRPWASTISLPFAHSTHTGGLQMLCVFWAG